MSSKAIFGKRLARRVLLGISLPSTCRPGILTNVVVIVLKGIPFEFIIIFGVFVISVFVQRLDDLYFFVLLLLFFLFQFTAFLHSLCEPLNKSLESVS